MTAMLSSNTIRKIKSRTPIKHDLISRLVLLYRPQIIEFLVKQQSVQWADAEDLSGLVLERVVEKRSQFKGAKQSEFWSWIRTISRRIAIDHFRKNRNRERNTNLAEVDEQELVSTNEVVDLDFSPTEFLSNIMMMHLKYRKSAVAKELHDEIQWVCSDWEDDECATLMTNLFQQMQQWLVQNIQTVFSIGHPIDPSRSLEAIESEKTKRDAASWQSFLLIHVMNLNSPLSANLVNKTAAAVRKSAERIYRGLSQELEATE